MTGEPRVTERASLEGRVLAAIRSVGPHRDEATLLHAILAAVERADEGDERLRAHGCVFCEKAEGVLGPVAIFPPLNPVTPGHLLVVPTTHVASAAESPDVTAATMREAARVAAGIGPCNLITSVGAEATQTVFHLHVHVVPRHAGDGLPLPWTPQQALAASSEARVTERASLERLLRLVEEAEQSAGYWVRHERVTAIADEVHRLVAVERADEGDERLEHAWSCAHNSNHGPHPADVPCTCGLTAAILPR